MSVTAVPIPPLPKGSVLKLWLGVAFLCLVGAGFAWLGTGGALQREVTDSGLGFRVVEEGTGEPMTSADLIALRYRLKIGGPDGRLIQDSDQTGQPLVATTQSLVPGFNEALLRMRQGGSYELWVPPALGYGDRVPPGAPFGPNDTLFFEVNVIQIERNMAALQSLFGPGGGGAQEGPPPAEGPAGAGGAPPSTGEPAGNRQ